MLPHVGADINNRQCAKFKLAFKLLALQGVITDFVTPVMDGIFEYLLNRVQDTYDNLVGYKLLYVFIFLEDANIFNIRIS